jgi:hypothetical protein
MAHFAELDENNKVLRVIVVRNEEINNEEGLKGEAIGINYCKSLYGEETLWAQTSYNSTFRKNFACVDSVLDTTRNAFVFPKPFESWILDEETCRWEAPIPMPTDDKGYDWDEPTLSWKEIGA